MIPFFSPFEGSYLGLCGERCQKPSDDLSTPHSLAIWQPWASPGHQRPTPKSLLFFEAADISHCASPCLVLSHDTPIFRSSQRWRILKQIWSYHYLNSMLRPFCAFSHNSRQIAHNSAGCSMSFRLNFVVPASTPGMLWGTFSPRWLPFIKFLLSFCM